MDSETMGDQQIDELTIYVGFERLENSSQTNQVGQNGFHSTENILKGMGTTTDMAIDTSDLGLSNECLR